MLRSTAHERGRAPPGVSHAWANGPFDEIRLHNKSSANFWLRSFDNICHLRLFQHFKLLKELRRLAKRGALNLKPFCFSWKHTSRKQSNKAFVTETWKQQWAIWCNLHLLVFIFRGQYLLLSSIGAFMLSTSSIGISSAQASLCLSGGHSG